MKLKFLLLVLSAACIADNVSSTELDSALSLQNNRPIVRADFDDLWWMKSTTDKTTTTKKTKTPKPTTTTERETRTTKATTKATTKETTKATTTAGSGGGGTTIRVSYSSKL